VELDEAACARRVVGSAACGTPDEQWGGLDGAAARVQQGSEVDHGDLELGGGRARVVKEALQQQVPAPDHGSPRSMMCTSLRLAL